MKKFVIELLQQKDLEHLFNEPEYNGYKAKLYKRNSQPNKYYMALLIMDMFILNASPC